MPNSRLFDADAEQLQLVASKFHAIAQPVRLRIAMLLVQREQSVMQLVRRIGSCTQSNVSQHLAVMRQQNLVTSSHEYGHTIYRLTDPVLIDWLPTLFACWTDNRHLN